MSAPEARCGAPTCTTANDGRLIEVPDGHRYKRLLRGSRWGRAAHICFGCKIRADAQPPARGPEMGFGGPEMGFSPFPPVYMYAGRALVRAGHLRGVQRVPTTHPPAPPRPKMTILGVRTSCAATATTHQLFKASGSRKSQSS
jgi:hypothetical protein